MKKSSTVTASITARQISLTSSITLIDSSIAASEREIERHNKSREEALSRLAEMYAEDDGALAARFTETTSKVQLIFNEKRARRESIILNLKEIEEKEKLLNCRRVELDKIIAAQHDNILDIRSRIAIALKSNEEFALLSEEIAELHRFIAKDEARLKTLREECNEEITRYTNDEVFRYLVAVNYSKPEYKAGLFPKMDRWLARVSHFEENLKRYEILLQIPDRVARANQERRELALAKTARVNEITANVEKEYGLTGLPEQLCSEQKARANIAETLQKLVEGYSALTKEKDKIDSKSDAYLKRAKEALKSLFSSEDVKRLYQRAKETASPEDDKLVEIIETANREIDSNRAAAKKLIKERKSLEEQLARNKKLEAVFKSKDYDSNRGRFDDTFEESMILSYESGHVAENILLYHLAAHYSPEPSYHNSYDGYGRYSSHGSSDYSSRSSSDSSSYSSSSSFSSSSSDSYSSNSYDSSSSSSSYDSGGSFDSGGSCSSGGGFD